MVDTYEPVCFCRFCTVCGDHCPDNGFHPLNAFALSLIVNARHIFYSISMLETYKDMGKIKPYLVFGLCDETFSIVSSAKPPQGVEAKPFTFYYVSQSLLLVIGRRWAGFSAL